MGRSVFIPAHICPAPLPAMLVPHSLRCSRALLGPALPTLAPFSPFCPPPPKIIPMAVPRVPGEPVSLSSHPEGS